MGWFSANQFRSLESDFCPSEDPQRLQDSLALLKSFCQKNQFSEYRPADCQPNGPRGLFLTLFRNTEMSGRKAPAEARKLPGRWWDTSLPAPFIHIIDHNCSFFRNAGNRSCCFVSCPYPPMDRPLETWEKQLDEYFQQYGMRAQVFMGSPYSRESSMVVISRSGGIKSHNLNA